MHIGKQLLEELIKDSPLSTYGLFEATLIKDLWLDIDLWNLESYPLYQGDSDPIAEAIPYLIKLDSTADNDACIHLLSHFGKNAMFLMQTNLDADKLLEKFRYFYHILVDGESMLQRFYDPRVFDSFISQISLEERKNFFTGIESVFVESSQNKMTEYIMPVDKLLIRTTRLERSEK